MRMMTDYNKYLDGLMSSCQRIVEQSYHQAQYIPQYLASQSSIKLGQPAIPENPLPAASPPADSAPVIQAAPGQMAREGLQNGPDQEAHLRYEKMSWRTMSNELNRRGLICGGTHAELVKRLETDDELQAETRTAVDYEKMDRKDLSSLCTRRSLPSQGTDLLLRNRLKTYDERRLVMEGANWPGSALKVDSVELDARKGMQPGQIIHKACNACRKGKRRCVHDANGNEDPARAIESVQRPARIARIEDDSTGIMVRDPAPAAEELAGERVTRARGSTAKVCVSHGKLETPAQNKHTGKDVERASVSIAKPSVSQSESESEHVEDHMEEEDDIRRPRRPQLFYKPKDDILLLQICVNLKNVIDWGNINGFWNMVQDTLQQETGKPYKKVSRHVRLLVDKRRAELDDIKQEGKIVISRVSAGCRPLLDKWIAGGKPVRHASRRASFTPSVHEDEDDARHVEKERQQLDADDSALELQKRSAPDTWLDTPFDTTRKKSKLRTSELSCDTSKSSAASAGCWSLSGSSVTSESSVEDESEDDGEDDVKDARIKV